MALPNRFCALVVIGSALLAMAVLCRGQEANAAKAKAFYADGTARAGRGDLLDAIVDFSKAIDLEPKNPLAYSARGNAKFNTGDLDGAVADHSKAIELDPTRRTPYINRGVVRVDQGDLQGAIADYTKAIELDPQSSTAFLNRGNARLQNGDAAGARSDYEQAVQFAKDEAAYPRFALFLLNTRLETKHQTEFMPVVHGWKPGWKKSLGLFLGGEITEADLFALAIQGDTKAVREHKCEAFYYAGAMRLLKGDRAGARTLFEKSVTTQLHSFSEFQFARAELARPAASEATKP